MGLSIIAIGNPGSGKSTTLNYLAQKLIFKSGVAIGSGLTYELNKVKVNGITYCDTPGLNDAKKREAFGKAISEALKVRNFM
jgi:predicted GTPase